MQYKNSSKRFGRTFSNRALFILLLLLSLAYSASSQEALVALDNLELQIQNLEKLEQNLIEQDKNLLTLKEQLAALQKEIENSKNLTVEQKALLEKLTLQLEALKTSKEVWLNNYEKLLSLSKAYKQAYETTSTISWVLGGVTVVCVGVIGGFIIASNSK